ncbi:hypothetical protein [Actinoallomurus iriomotensis]|uniref:Uncharacterized protein n=1 Tax=Actinoallomurus iriomotensis TaxID=478107 RepID=A0A9W6RUG4_9ACTN|nr:hypothetical protein [Actinoallomurus iriomotensis]GLY82020.1 hypothetical protein Airi01_102870 [Actinoallomurus iriomotensis]
MDYSATELAALLRIGAQGCLSDQAAVGLLTDHDLWLHRSDFARTCVTVETDPFVPGEEIAAFIDWGTAIRLLVTGALPCSPSEAAMLRIAAGLAGVPVNLRAMLGGLDSRNIQLVAEAVMHANGTRSDIHGEVA